MIKKFLLIVAGIFLLQSVSLAAYSVSNLAITNANSLETYTVPTNEGQARISYLEFVNGAGYIYDSSAVATMDAHFCVPSAEAVTDLGAKVTSFKPGSQIIVASPTARNIFSILYIY